MTEKKDRKCLMCDQVFKQEYEFNRVCPVCRRSYAWQQGTDDHALGIKKSKKAQD